MLIDLLWLSSVLIVVSLADAANSSGVRMLLVEFDCCFARCCLVHHLVCLLFVRLRADAKLPTELQFVNLAGVDLSKRDLSRHNFTGANLTGANLSGAKLTGM